MGTRDQSTRGRARYSLCILEEQGRTANKPRRSRLVQYLRHTKAQQQSQAAIGGMGGIRSEGYDMGVTEQHGENGARDRDPVLGKFEVKEA